MTTNDCLNRRINPKETLLAEIITRNNEISELKDAYRAKHPKDGFTWKRGNIYSRLDYIYVSEILTTKIVKAKTNWALDKSDHAAVEIDFKLKDNIKRGPGIIKLNTKILEDPIITKEVELEIKNMMEQTLPEWNPHTKLEFLKVTIRSVLSSKVANIRNEIKEEITNKENSINLIEELRIKATNNPNLDNDIRKTRTEACDEAKFTLMNELNTLRNKLDENLTFVAKAKWFEYGEKSNKFFLNLNNCRQNRKNINEINDNDLKFEGQEQVTKGITELYRKLYKKVDGRDSSDQTNFYDNCPKLTNEQTQNMDQNLNLSELKEAL